MLLLAKMNNNRFIIQLLLTAVIAAVAYSTPTDNSEEAAKQLMQEIDHKLQQKDASYLNHNDTLSAKILMREQLRPYFARMQQFDWRNFNDQLLKRQFEIILRGAKYPKLDNDFVEATRTLLNMKRQRWSCERWNPRKCNLAYVHQIKSILRKSNDTDEIKYYWAEWRNKQPVTYKSALQYFVQYYQNLSTPHQKPSAIWYEDYDEPNLLHEFENFIETIKPFYTQLHAHLRQALRHKYGDKIFNGSNLIPADLMEQVIYQAWKKESVLENPFPDRPLPNLQFDLKTLYKNPKDLVNLSQTYFIHLGYNNLTHDFMERHVTEMPNAGPDCHSRFVEFGDMQLFLCPKVNFKHLMQVHGDVARLQYSLTKTNLSVGLREEACPGFSNAIAESIILSVSNPTHLQKCLRMLPEYNYDDFLNLNRLYRLTVHTLLTLPLYFVHEKLWVNMIDGNLEVNQYNKHYWHLMEQHLGVGRPIPTHGSGFDMPYKFYEGIISESSSTRKLFGEFLGYQIYREICLNIGEYEPGNSYKILTFCDFDQNSTSGNYLRNLMGSGSTKNWRELIKTLTKNQSDRLSAASFLEYFDPVHNWLTQYNLENKIPVGW